MLCISLRVQVREEAGLLSVWHSSTMSEPSNGVAMEFDPSETVVVGGAA